MSETEASAVLQRILVARKRAGGCSSSSPDDHDSSGDEERTVLDLRPSAAASASGAEQPRMLQFYPGRGAFAFDSFYTVEPRVRVALNGKRHLAVTKFEELARQSEVENWAKLVWMGSEGKTTTLRWVWQHFNTLRSSEFVCLFLDLGSMGLGDSVKRSGRFLKGLGDALSAALGINESEGYDLIRHCMDPNDDEWHGAALDWITTEVHKAGMRFVLFLDEAMFSESQAAWRRSLLRKLQGMKQTFYAKTPTNHSPRKAPDFVVFAGKWDELWIDNKAHSDFKVARVQLFPARWGRKDIRMLIQRHLDSLYAGAAAAFNVGHGREDNEVDADIPPAAEHRRVADRALGGDPTWETELRFPGEAVVWLRDLFDGHPAYTNEVLHQIFFDADGKPRTDFASLSYRDFEKYTDHVVREFRLYEKVQRVSSDPKLLEAVRKMRLQLKRDHAKLAAEGESGSTGESGEVAEDAATHGVQQSHGTGLSQDVSLEIDSHVAERLVDIGVFTEVGLRLDDKVLRRIYRFYHPMLGMVFDLLPDISFHDRRGLISDSGNIAWEPFLSTIAQELVQRPAGIVAQTTWATVNEALLQSLLHSGMGVYLTSLTSFVSSTFEVCPIGRQRIDFMAEYAGRDGTRHCIIFEDKLIKEGSPHFPEGAVISADLVKAFMANEDAGGWIQLKQYMLQSERRATEGVLVVFLVSRQRHLGPTVLTVESGQSIRPAEECQTGEDVDERKIRCFAVVIYAGFASRERLSTAVRRRRDGTAAITDASSNASAEESTGVMTRSQKRSRKGRQKRRRQG